MDKQRHDITLIQKYLSGELDAKAMHQLERQAQHDPFLMDAIEGYEASANNQSANLSRLSQRLQERVEEKQRRIIPWWMMAAAAGVIGFMVVVGLLYNRNKPINAPLSARNEHLPPADTIPKSLPPATIDSVPVLAIAPPRTKETKAARQYRNDRTLVESETPQITDTTRTIAAQPQASASSELPLDERVMDVIAKQRDSGEMPAVVAISKKPLSQPLTGKVEGVTKKEREGRPEYNNRYYLGDLATVQPPKVDVKSKVIAAENNPVAATGTGLAAPSQSTSRFKTSTAKDSANTSMGYIGSANGKDAGSQLAEVTVVRAESTARPLIGMEAYNAYIAQQAVLPAGEKTGDVKLKFDVSPNGTISNISVVKSLSSIADAKARSIVSNGPSWKGNDSGKSQQVLFTVTFRSL
ncbi:hypothetical protein DYU05_19920 [Mucilaginibacter terrenus]|uniref:TonB C-terminal domain-containing protein n=2 Tax=Mucilaginibacter terrenus TaxID=2482727 RepID=A0A3E2NJS6_9SPHI|nr:energy transducer TonB [Mucilaginibacter terrenus]RFZ81252.1 hypothetical protein DYU05_19920 [Mucilaginibacter terrenus]